MKKPEFTLLGVTQFMEAQGFHVEKAEEIEADRPVSDPLGKKGPGLREIGAIVLRITPKKD